MEFKPFFGFFNLFEYSIRFDPNGSLQSIPPYKGTTSNPDNRQKHLPERQFGLNRRVIYSKIKWKKSRENCFNPVVCRSLDRILRFQVQLARIEDRTGLLAADRAAGMVDLEHFAVDIAVAGVGNLDIL